MIGHNYQTVEVRFMLQIKNLQITMKKDLRTIISGLSFTLNAGDKAVIIGEEGNGKSTLLKLIFNPALVEGYTDYTGDIVKQGIRLGYLAQELDDADKALEIAVYCAEIPGFFDRAPRELGDIAFRLGLQQEMFFSEQRVGTLSGGERVKLQLARLLIEQPDILLLDEPSNDIDIETLEWLERFISESDVPVLYVSHDETLIERTANVVIHLELVRRKTLARQTVARLPYQAYIDTRLGKLTHQEQLARKEKSELDAKLERFRKIQQKVEHEQATISRADPHGGRLLKKKMKAVKSLEHRIERESEDMTQLPDVEEAILVKFGDDIEMPRGKTVLDLSLDSLTVGDRVLARDIRLHVAGPEKLVIIGRNGVGKTTLLKRIAGELLPRGDIKCGYMPQNYEETLDMTKTPVSFLSSVGDKAETTKIRAFLGSMKYTTDEMTHAAAELSGGQKAKLMFLKMILGGCQVLLLDEPTRNFSPLSNPVIRDVLKAYKGTIISISHDRKYIGEVCSTVYELTEKGLSVIDTR
jgi:ATPase subunit of ABC transporter with duplicated ATPase domains